MPFPSVQVLQAAAQRAALRFPAVLVAAIVAAVAGMILVGNETEEFWVRLMLTAALAIPLFLSVDLAAERWRWHIGVRAGLWLVGAGLLTGFLAMWPDWSEPVKVGRYLQLSAAFHLLAAVAPYLGVRELNGFWQYNRQLFFRGIAAALFAGALFVGLSVAVLALDQLFGMNVPEETYGRLWFLIAFVFATWFFLAGVPDDFTALERSEDYDRSLKIFAQYVLVPLVGIYLLILTVYLVKVLVTQEWPSGWIGWLVSSVAAAGIFSILMVHPIAERAENRWMRTYARAFYFTILPPIVMLWLALGQRIGQYGITERRYFLAVLSVWLGGVALYYAVTRSRDIRIIPASLGLVALVTFAGPWSAYRVSESSQIGRLASLLERNGMLIDGAAREASAPVPLEDRREISASIRYLVATHGTDGLVSLFGEQLATVDPGADGASMSARDSLEATAGQIVGLVGVEYVGPWAPPGSDRFSYYMNWDRAPIGISGYDVWVQADNLIDNPAAIAAGVSVRYDSTAVALVLDVDGTSPSSLPLAEAIDRAAAVQQESGRRALDPETMRIEWAFEGGRLLVFLARVSGEQSEEGLQLTDLDLRLFYAPGS